MTGETNAERTRNEHGTNTRTDDESRRIYPARNLRAFGTPDELAPILDALTPRPDLLPVEGGDHSFSVPKSAGTSQSDLFARIQDAIATWIQRQP